jgi:hypothetical protein
MNLPILIESDIEYQMCTDRGYQPLLDNRFKMDFDYRIEVQKRFKTDSNFYKWCWNNMPNVCEEYGKPLHHYSAVHISHILSRGAFPEMRFDPRNINILSFHAHNRWEFGNKSERQKMYIYTKNKKRIEMLKDEYKNYFKI